MLLRNLITGDIFEVLIMENSTTGTTSITIQQVIAEIEKYVGKGNKLTFEGTLSDGIITFVPPIGSYEIKEGYDYEIELILPDTSGTRTYDDATAMVIVNGGVTYRFWTVEYYPALWQSLKKLYWWDARSGYVWRFKARYHVTSDNQDFFYIFPTVNTIQPAKEYELGGVMPDNETINVDENGVISRATNNWTFLNETMLPEWHKIDTNMSYQLDLSYQLPDNKNYEVMFELYGEHQGSIYDIVNICCFTDYTANNGGFSDDVFCLIKSQQFNDTSTFAKQPYHARCTVPVGIDKYIMLQNKSSKDVYICLKIIAYRPL